MASGDAITTGGTNTAVGSFSLSANTTAGGNTAVGYQSLTANTTGVGNASVGSNALDANTTGAYNVAFGFSALGANTTAGSNVAIGASALEFNTTGASNTAVGTSSLDANTTGDNLTAVGLGALGANTTADNNTAVGRSALTANTTGTANVAVGKDAGKLVTTGSYNTFIGTYAGQSSPTTSANRIALGYNVAPVGDAYFTFGEGDGSDRVYNLFTSNASWTRASDERIKKNITTNTDCGLDFINDLRTVTYKFKAPSELDSTMSEYNANKTTPTYDKKMYGFVAQEVKVAMDKHNITDFAGWHQIDDDVQDNMQGISYEMFVMPLVKAVQELSAQVTTLTARITELEG